MLPAPAQLEEHSPHFIMHDLVNGMDLTCHQGAKHVVLTIPATLEPKSIVSIYHGDTL